MKAQAVPAILVIAAALALTGCAGGAAPAPTPTTITTPSAQATVAAPAPAPAPPGGEGGTGPVDAYLEWLAASREPNAARACSLMAEGLQERMLAQFAASLGSGFASCEEMITETAALYAAVGASADVEVEVVAESTTDATLFATYVDTGKCGTIHLASTAGGWVLTEQSEECAG